MDERQAQIEAQRKYGMARMTYEASQGEPLLRLGRAFADPMRVRLLALLAERSMYGQELAEALHVVQSYICTRIRKWTKDRHRSRHRENTAWLE